MSYPTKAVDGLVLREMKSEVATALGKMADVLVRIVDFGTHVVWWSGADSASKDSNLLPPLMLLYHAVEAADAISILLRVGAVDPCGPLLRSEIEAEVSARYILESDTTRRGAAYRYGLLYDELEALERMDPSTAKGRAQAAKLASDKTLGTALPSVDPTLLADQITRVKSVMNQPKYHEIAAEWKRLEKKRTPPWYALFGGPTNIGALAERIGRAGWYVIFYRHFSDEVHSTTAMKSIRGDSKTGKASFRPIRYPENAPNVLSLCASVLVTFYGEIIDRLCPSHKPKFLAWYVETIRPELNDLVRVEFKSPVD